ncbi:uncharacterized protein LOC144437061 [Glandiceps talaboti]
MARLTSLDTMNKDAVSLQIDPYDATCGITQPTRYCSLLSTSSCLVCANNVPALAHPPELILDLEAEESSPTYWQSRSWTDFPTPLEINITISLGMQYELQDDITITFQSGLPRKMILAKSMDYGNSWDVLQYYSSDCVSDFGMVSDMELSNPSQITCTEQYNTLTTEFGENIVFSVTPRFTLLAGPDNADTQNIYNYLEADEKFRNLLTLTDLQIRLLTPAYLDNQTTDQNSLAASYYAISNVAMRLRCQCNLHGQYCDYVNGAVSCVCKHNTEGQQCEKCHPDYTAAPWQPGSYLPYPNGQAKQCFQCECNGHSNECRYDSTRDEVICLGCQHNTVGPHCEKCLPQFYRDHSKLLNDPDVCKDEVVNSTSSPIPSNSQNTANLSPSMSPGLTPSMTPNLSPSLLPTTLPSDTPDLQPTPNQNGSTQSLSITVLASNLSPSTSILGGPQTSSPVPGNAVPVPDSGFDPCTPSSCSNGGTCIADSNQDFQYRCQCAPGFYSQRCTEETNECQSNPCKDGQICVDLVNAYDCRIAPTPPTTTEPPKATGLSEMMIIVIAVCSVAVVFCIVWTVFFAWYTMLDHAGNRVVRAPRFGNPLSPMAKLVEEKKKKLKEQNQNSMIIENATSHEQMGKKSHRVPLIPDNSSSVKMHALKAKWDIPEDKLAIGRLIDNGEFCYVKEGQFTRKDGSEVKVACKLLKDPKNNMANRELLNEFEILAHMNPDPRIVVLHGICNKIVESNHFTTQYCLATEYVSNGSLLKYLRRCRSRKREDAPRHSIPFPELMNIISDVAMGMKFLVSEKLIHRKLAAANILVTFNNRAKISDFGLAQDMYEFGDFVMTNEPVRRSLRRWLAYESLLDGAFSAKSDVWSFGIVLWEIATLGSIPYPNISTKRLPEKLKEHYRMEKPKHVSQEYYDTMLRCWHRKPESRPSFELLVKEMKKLQKSGKTHIVFKEYTFVHYYGLRETPDSDAEDDSFV